jgi:hypothetical protein
MRSRRIKYEYCWSAVLFVFLCLPSAANGQIYSQFCKQGNLTGSDSVLIEVARIGRGMTWPLLPQLFLRVYNDGRIQYELVDDKMVVTKKAELDSTTLERLRKIVEAKDLAESRSEYPKLKSVSDAMMKICVSYKSVDHPYRQILLINYAVDHPRARDYYPHSLVELLRMVEEIRPSNEYERKYGYNKLSWDE